MPDHWVVLPPEAYVPVILSPADAPDAGFLTSDGQAVPGRPDSRPQRVVHPAG